MAARKDLMREVLEARIMVKRNVEELYSCMCIVLHDRGMSDDEIIEVIGQISDKWDEISESSDNACDLCLKLTGFDIRENR